MKNIEWKNERRKVIDLLPADYNPRLLTEKEKEDLTESIKRFSTVEPVVINIGKRNNILIGGHARIVIYADLGIEEIDVRVPNRELTIEEETELNLRLNKNTGSWDPIKLKDLSLDLLSDVGFDSQELSAMFDDSKIINDKFDVEKEIKAARTTTVKSGEIYQLGSHRLMCGDSTLLDDVKKLMGGGFADIIYCDPPYNIGLDYNKGVGSAYGNDQAYGGEYRDGSDSKSEIDYSTFISATVENAIASAKKDAHVFYWCDQNYIHLLQEIFIKNKIKLRRVCLWIKNGMNLTPQFAFNKCYEPCVYGVKGRPHLHKTMTKMTEIMNSEVETGNIAYEQIKDIIDLWLVKRDTGYLHPTQKPLSLHEKPLKRCGAPGQVVLDLFGGSGSTLMACDQLKLVNYSMEKDPIFCQVIINRYQKFT